MNLLLDTHILIWALCDDVRLSEKARDLILDADNVIYYSPVSVWEVSLKHALHPDNVSFTSREMARFAQEAGFLSLAMRERHVFAAETLVRKKNTPEHHDPFDRLLVGQAKAENMSFLTHDALLPDYEERCIIPV
ncbi:MAG: type II toxin-antitoxin system VapC family toxin [Solobacterium sp.]|nr:type II toxin-antitoxin system VapC family toxin [Solobacterium sp.]